MLVVAMPINPSRGGSVIIMEKLIKHFSRDEVVLFGELPPLGKAPKRDADRPQAHYFRSKFSLLGRGDRFLAPIRWMLFSLLVRKIRRTIEREKCDYVLGVYPDEYYCYAACLAAKQAGVRFSTYFHNTYIDNEAIDATRGNKIQPVLLESSEFVFVISDGLKRFYQRQYGLDNVITLVHTFEDLPAAEQPRESLSEKDSVSLVLIGNFNQSNIEATRRLVDAVSQSDRYRIYMYTHVPIALLKMRGIDTSRIQHMGYIDDANLIVELRKYDIAVLTHGFDGGYGPIEYETIFPTRTIPMLLCGRPILVHSPPNAFLTEFTKHHHFGHLVDVKDKEALIQGLDRISNDTSYATDLTQTASKTVMRFHGANVASVLRETIGLSQ